MVDIYFAICVFLQLGILLANKSSEQQKIYAVLRAALRQNRHVEILPDEQHSKAAKRSGIDTEMRRVNPTTALTDRAVCERAVSVEVCFNRATG